jgi:hypothetical protein
MSDKNLIRLSKITSPGQDDKQFPAQQVQYLGKVADGIMVFPYGMHANVPADILSLMFSVQNLPDNRFSIPFNTSKRPKLEAGEVAFFHPLLPDLIIKLQANGKMLVKSGVALDVDAPDATFSGNVAIAGNLTVEGTSTFNGTMTNNGKDVGDTHGHTQTNDSAGDGQAAISGVT